MKLPIEFAYCLMNVQAMQQQIAGTVTLVDHLPSDGHLLVLGTESEHRVADK